jgi:hypothetical protein
MDPQNNHQNMQNKFDRVNPASFLNQQSNKNPIFVHIGTQINIFSSNSMNSQQSSNFLNSNQRQNKNLKSQQSNK